MATSTTTVHGAGPLVGSRSFLSKLREGDEIVWGHLNPARQQKILNIARDPRVTLTIGGRQTNPHGLREYLVVYGTARVLPGGAFDLLRRLARVYMGPDTTFPPDRDPPAGLDWDRWLGPAPKVPYNPNRCLYKFRWFWDSGFFRLRSAGRFHRELSIEVCDVS